MTKKNGSRPKLSLIPWTGSNEQTFASGPNDVLMARRSRLRTDFLSGGQKELTRSTFVVDHVITDNGNRISLVRQHQVKDHL